MTAPFSQNVSKLFSKLKLEQITFSFRGEYAETASYMYFSRPFNTRLKCRDGMPKSMQTRVGIMHESKVNILAKPDNTIILTTDHPSSIKL